MTVEIGERVGVLEKSTNEIAYIYGYGVRVEDEVPGEEVGGLAPYLRTGNLPCPVLLLDNGKKVYGCECYWGSEKALQDYCATREVIIVDIDEARKHA